VNDADIVADASAVIALLVGEPFTGFDALRLPNASISAVNLSEVLARLQEIGMPEAEIDNVLARLNLRVIAFDEPQPRATAQLHSVTRHAGLSLGDRACLGLGGILGCPVVTADRVWASVNVGVEVIVIQ
jgi:PIN domain nuclease of toxin-antitoxin system